jgi:acyl-CoA synthetase (AMP-forming)/AMP-acid ligase II
MVRALDAEPVLTRSPYPALSIPDVSVPELLLGPMRGRGSRPALVESETGRAVASVELVEQAERAAAGLARRRLRRGDVAAVLLPNVTEFAAAFLGVALAGGAVTTLSPDCSEEELARQVRESGARVVITDGGLLPWARAVEAAVAIMELLEAAGPPPERRLEPAADLVALLSSSGTTGLPRGVMQTHRNAVAQVLQNGALGMDGADVSLAVAPFFHAMGLHAVLIAGLHAGATIVTMARFELARFLGAIERHRVTCCVAAPPVAAALATDPLVDAHDLSSLRWLAFGGAPLPAGVEQAVAARLGCMVGQGWGMTELTWGAAMPPFGHPSLRLPPGAAGLLAAGCEVQVADVATGVPLPAGERGELHVRGPNVMAGYHERPAETAATLDEGGWLHTGDIGAVSEDGAVFVAGRIKELIKYRGYQIAPVELEAILETHPAIAEAAVVGFPDREAGEVPKAFLVLRPGADPVSAPAQAVAALAERVAPYQRVPRWEVIDALPRTVSGQLLRRPLAEREPPPAR